MISLKVVPSDLEFSRLVYAKYLFDQGNRYLENNSIEQYFNIAIILSANAVDVFVHTLAYCVFGQDHTKEKISDVLTKLKKEILDFPYTELSRVTEARNGIYHRVELKTYKTCRDLREITERVFKKYYSEYLNVDYNKISMVDLIKDAVVREPLKNAEHFLIKDNYLDSVIASCEGFAKLKYRINERGRYQVGDNHPDLFSNTEISWVKELKKFASKIESPQALIPLSNHIEEQINKKIINLARHFDFLLMLGSSYEDYKHFESIRPVYLVFVGGEFKCIRESAVKMNYQREQAEFIFNFVLRTVLDIEPKLRTIEVRSLSKDVIKKVE